MLAGVAHHQPVSIRDGSAGGDEFVVLLENIADGNDGRLVTSRFAEALRPVFALCGR